MKRNLYTHVSGLLLFFFFAPFSASAQTCSGLAVTYTTSESRCMATGIITVRATGGSGNYNYKAVGPITTSFTSSNVITGLQPGIYTVVVRDITRNCQVEQENIVVNGTYSDPRFLLTGTDVTCAGNDGTITVTGQQFGRSPFAYTIVAPSPAGVGITNTTGLFQNLIAGEYAVQLRDSCGGIQVRRITLQDYAWWFDGVTVTKTDCNNATARIHLKDNKGNGNTTSTAFAGFSYGVVNSPGDTTWAASNTFSFFTGSKLTFTFVAKDPCGNRHTYIWAVPANAKPSVGAIGINNTCTRFTATVNGRQNLTNPTFYLFNSANRQIATNRTGIFTGLAYGSYCIRVKDGCYDTTIVRCFTAAQPAPSVSGAVSINNRTCNTFTAAITGQSNLFNPSYCLYNSNNVLLACNSTGIFTGLAYGSYCIKVTDGCTRAVITRCFTAAKPVPVLTSYAISGQNCTTFDVSARGDSLVNPTYCLYDSLGNVVACNATGIFNGIRNGNYCLRAVSCGDTTNALCFSGAALKPAVAAAVRITNKECNTFSAAITGQINLTAPRYCLYNTADVELACNGTGTFDNLPYGSYCVKITDGCYDTTITRCFTQTKPVPAIGARMQQLSSTCTTFTARVTGQQNLFNPRYCLYDASNNLVACNALGVFTNLPYGTYCLVTTDGCTGTAFRICQTFSYEYDVRLTASKACTIGSTNVAVSFANGNGPFAIQVFRPDQTVVYSNTVISTTRIELPGLPHGAVYTVVGTDACGRKDTATIAPDVSTVTKSIAATGKCPSATWLNGSGDLTVNAASNLGSVTPRIIRKNGVTFSKNHSSNSGTVYVFSDLEPATYEVEYSIQNCNTKVYDTFALQPYAYPTQGRSAIYQCDNKGISLTAEVAGGVGPYNYQIIGSEPDVPSIVSSEQSSATFNINTGTTYSLIRLRTVDACGNATLNDVSVLPLQNVLITADTSCLFSSITLSVDTIPGAVYSWYKRRSGDSAYLGNTKTYTIPVMQQQDIGTYVCKVELNNSCLTRLASFELTGDCGHVYLPVSLTLTGKAAPEGNRLNWGVGGTDVVQQYVVERRLSNEESFSGAGTVLGNNTTGRYEFTDSSLQYGVAVYRVKAVLQNGRFSYSNSVRLQREGYSTAVYPNPVRNSFVVSINGSKSINYRMELQTVAGQLVYMRTLQNVTQAQQRFERPKELHRGLYVLKVVNVATGASTHHKLLFD